MKLKRKQHQERQYLQLIREILTRGKLKKDRTGTGTKSIFGTSMRFNLKKEFPLFTTKQVHFKSIMYELLWFISGSSNIKYLTDNKINIWNQWADKNGELGPIYGVQWRKWKNSNNEEIDQLAQLIHNLKTNPYSRRHILNAWNVGEIDNMALPPCHILAQFEVSETGDLSCIMYQRSTDVFLELPFNIASYSLLTMILSQICGLRASEFIWMGGDTHIYINHVEQCTKQINRNPIKLPKIKINKNLTDIDKILPSDITLIDYVHHPKITAPIAV